MLNQAITRFSDGQVEAARALPSGYLVLRVDSEKTRQDLHKQGGWITTLEAGVRLNKPWLTVLVKSVHLNALDCNNQEMPRGTLTQQNLYLREVELIHVGPERPRARQAGSPAKASTILINVASLQQANLLIQENLVLGLCPPQLSSSTETTKSPTAVNAKPRARWPGSAAKGLLWVVC